MFLFQASCFVTGIVFTLMGNRIDKIVAQERENKAIAENAHVIIAVVFSGQLSDCCPVMSL
jgi:hypothetical protein